MVFYGTVLSLLFCCVFLSGVRLFFCTPLSHNFGSSLLNIFNLLAIKKKKKKCSVDKIDK